MKYTKGFIGIGMIIAIVAVLAVGGGVVYYYATKTPAPYSNTGENNYQPVNQNQNSTTPTNTQNQNSNSRSTSVVTPTITVISPNGGETYKIGDNINLKYKNDSFPKNTLVTIHIIDGPTPINLMIGTLFGVSDTQTFTIFDPASPSPLWKNFQPGNYKMQVKVWSPDIADVLKSSCRTSSGCIYPDKYLIAQDKSDNYFTINN